MDPLTIVDVLSRWLHVGTTIVLLGGSVFMRFVLMPSANSSLGDAEHDALRAQLMGRWKKVVHAGIGLLLLSGLWNYLMVAAPAHRGDGLYHALMGVKMLLALGVFFLASVLIGRSPKFESLRQNRARSLSVLILMAALVVSIGGLLKVCTKPAIPSDSASNLPE